MTDEVRISNSLREYVMAAKQKRPYGVLTQVEIAHVLLELLPERGRIDRKILIKKAAEFLEFPDTAYKRIDEVIDSLEKFKKLWVDNLHIWRRDS